MMSENLSPCRYTVLHAAASYSHSDLLAYALVRPDVDVNVKDGDGDTPLHVLIECVFAREP